MDIYEFETELDKLTDKILSDQIEIRIEELEFDEKNEFKIDASQIGVEEILKERVIKI